MDDGGTLGALMRHRMTMTAHCEACGHFGRLDLDRLADRLGSDWSYIGRVPPGLVCSRCRSGRISITIGGRQAEGPAPASTWGMMPPSLPPRDHGDE